MISWLRRTFLFFCTIELLLHPPLTSAQFPVGAVSGRVYDSSLAAVEGATLIIREVPTGVTRPVRTERDGYYRFEGLLPGEYVVEVSSPNFKTQLRNLTL